ncbi:PspA [Myxococcus dinghuensis]|uniref:PspA n=1 Tax=Myxococcus dinghuensis TaxID=2906761 RepID=UPI002B20E253|nr:PspA [Myxococcus dinghuensis]
MSAIRAVVAEEVSKTLGRQVELLERIAQYLGIPTDARAAVVPAAKRATPTSTRRRQEPSSAPVPKKRGRPRKEASETPVESADEASASPFKVGQTVSYKQGRGTFPSVVKSIDTEVGTVTLERQSDGKQVERPFAKVESA